MLRRAVGGENDAPTSISLKTKPTTLVLHRIERSSLVVVYKNAIDEAICLQAIDKTAKLLKTSEPLPCCLFATLLFSLAVPHSQRAFGCAVLTLTNSIDSTGSR